MSEIVLPEAAMIANTDGGPTAPIALPSAAAVPADQHVRDRIRTDLDTTLIIEAAAGTGKTTALVSRIVAVVASGRSELDRIVAVTFTDKAAGELKLRVRAEIERARHDHPDPIARARLDDSLQKLEEARIGTIHSFCEELLRERPVESAVDPKFKIAGEDAAAGIFNAAFDHWFEGALGAPGEGLRRILRRPEVTDREGPRPLLRAAAWELKDWCDFDAVWRHEPFERDREIDTLVDEIEALSIIATEGEPEDWLRRALEELHRPIAEATRLEAVRDRDYDGLEASLLRLVRGNDKHWRWRGAGDRFGQLQRSEVFAQRDALRDRLKNFRDRAGANLAPLLRDELWPVVGIYRDLKARAGRVDFLDLLLMARNLVRDNAAVRAELQTRFTHIFVDEFQDTDPLQAEILLLIAADDPAETNWFEVRPRDGKLFIVGDPKQSIYRFRRADVALYQEIKRRLLERGAALEYLTVPVPNAYSKFGRITNWSIEDSLPDAIAAFVRWLIDDSGWTVTEREHPDQRVPIRPRHVCILFRRLSAYGRDVTRGYVRALEGRHVPHVLVRGGSFHMREEVETIRNALAAIERPDDELAVFATLHGPLFAITDGALLRFRESFRSFNPFLRLPGDLPAPLKEVAEALNVIRTLHRGRNRRPLADTISRLLAATRAYAGFAIWPTGDQALANVMRLMDMARRYESISGATSMRGFVEDLEERAEREEAGEVPVVEEGAEGVRIMTVHRARGLEFPVVILADITCNETAAEARRFVDPTRRLCAQRLAGQAPRELLDHAEDELRRDAEEAVRLLYVAATRARDLIVAPVVGDERQDGWIGRLNPALYPAQRGSRMPLERHPAGCPEFHAELAGTRPDNAYTRSSGVTPGLHRPEAGLHEVVWWDPSILQLDARETMGLRQSELLKADDRKERSERGIREYEAWKTRREEIIAAGSVPALRVASATELSLKATLDLPEASSIEIERAPRIANRPRGKRFGTLVHSILAQIPLDSTHAAIAAKASFFGRLFDASLEETNAAIATVAAALQSPLMRRAARSKIVRREAPLLLKLTSPKSDDLANTSATTLVEGVADLAFIEQRDGTSRWIVVDFKTDFELDRRVAEYRTQLALYMRAITEATSTPSDGYLLLI
ncbi:MAG: UvrD-helicase domain-containing protein [Deltaproteobacteria bacterium]|nr:UvrD-helicase domain-containing protein [Deltaproteobacteria bacterium]